ncbi:MAG: MFS transporter [Cyclobacteriaceae bacterium]|nr:MFS transporter [Cyclobacteriaceae bacterium]
MTARKTKKIFTPYQIFIIAILAFLQFTVVLDFMVISPLGVMLMDELSISPSKFGVVVSAYAFSAGISGLLAAGFADKFDRKKFLLFFYVGFMIGTILCALAPNYHFLLIARIVSGTFGGVIASVSFSIITDLFPLNVRGRVMGFVQMAFAASQVLGLPVGLEMANRFDWHAPFWLIAIIGVLVGVIISIFMKPITAHLNQDHSINPFKHLYSIVSRSWYLQAFLAATLLATGGFMLMPFGSAFSVHNLGVDIKNQLPALYGITGVFTIIFGPILGKLSDSVGKYTMFVVGTILTSIIVAIYTNLGMTAFWLVVVINVIMFIGVSSRMIASSALITAVPDLKDRGAFMSVYSSVRQIAGGLAAALAGVIVVQQNDGPLQQYDILGYVVIATMLLSMFMMYFINRGIQRNASVENSSLHGPASEEAS